MNICILGAGAWGTAMAIHLNKGGHSVSLVPRRLKHAMEIAQTRKNQDYLPDVELPLSIQIGYEVGPAIMESDMILLACPSKGLKALLPEIKKHAKTSLRLKMILTLCKGLDPDTLQFPVEICHDFFGDTYLSGCFSGPTNALEVANSKPAAAVIAAKCPQDEILPFQKALHSDSLRVYWSEDVAGIELGACLKNVYAIAAGISGGLGLGDNARAALITRAVSEMVRFGSAIGGQVESFYGLGGLGDLIATCGGNWSRNKQFGFRIAKGEQAMEIVEKQKTIIEGFRSTDSFYRMAQQKNLDLPILSAVFSVLYEELNPELGLQSLMKRGVKKEI